ncbi:MAG: hypothetical protein AAFU85_30960, partial [Planctomycetota bacterium]
MSTRQNKRLPIEKAALDPTGIPANQKHTRNPAKFPVEVHRGEPPSTVTGVVRLQRRVRVYSSEGDLIVERSSGVGRPR